MRSQSDEIAPLKRLSLQDYVRSEIANIDDWQSFESRPDPKTFPLAKTISDLLDENLASEPIDVDKLDYQNPEFAQRFLFATTLSSRWAAAIGSYLKQGVCKVTGIDSKDLTIFEFSAEHFGMPSLSIDFEENCISIGGRQFEQITVDISADSQKKTKPQYPKITREDKERVVDQWLNEYREKMTEPMALSVAMSDFKTNLPTGIHPNAVTNHFFRERWLHIIPEHFRFSGRPKNT